VDQWCAPPVIDVKGGAGLLQWPEIGLLIKLYQPVIMVTDQLPLLPIDADQVQNNRPVLNNDK